jgi:hypothetical protein
MPIYAYLCKSGPNFHKTDFPEKSQKIYQIAVNLRATRAKLMSDKSDYVNFLKKSLKNIINSKD